MELWIIQRVIRKGLDMRCITRSHWKMHITLYLWPITKPFSS